MAVPDFQSLMLPLLQVLGDGSERGASEVTDMLAGQFALSEIDRAERLPSGQQTVFTNRVAWAKAHLKGAGLIECPTRGRWIISNAGRQVLSGNPDTIN